DGERKRSIDVRARASHRRCRGLPTAQADQQFTRLMDELSGTENRIAVARGDYNAAAQEYNSYIRQFPQTLTAKVTGAKSRNYFNVTNPGAREAPSVDFSRPAAGTTPSSGATATPKK